MWCFFFSKGVGGYMGRGISLRGLLLAREGEIERRKMIKV